MKRNLLSNQEIREHAKSNGVFLYQVADVLHISEPTMTRKMRKELPQSEKKHICAIIDDIAKSKTACNAAAG